MPKITVFCVKCNKSHNADECVFINGDLAECLDGHNIDLNAIRKVSRYRYYETVNAMRG